MNLQTKRVIIREGKNYFSYFFEYPRTNFEVLISKAGTVDRGMKWMSEWSEEGGKGVGWPI